MRSPFPCSIHLARNAIISHEPRHMEPRFLVNAVQCRKEKSKYCNHHLPEIFVLGAGSTSKEAEVFSKEFSRSGFFFPLGQRRLDPLQVLTSRTSLLSRWSA
jgi:hypothetical protein